MITHRFPSIRPQRPLPRGRPFLRRHQGRPRTLKRWKASAGVARVAREVAVQALLLPLGSHRDGLHQQVAADERALPRFAHAAEDLFAVAPAARLVDADLERHQSARRCAPRSRGRRWRCCRRASRCWRSSRRAARTRCRRRRSSPAGRTARRGAATTTPAAAGRTPGRRRQKCPDRRGRRRRRRRPR